MTSLTQSEREQIYKDYEYIVYTETAKYYHNTNFYQDLLQSGRIALWEAINRLDPEKSNGASIKTYLTRCIRNAVMTGFIKETSRISNTTGNDYGIIKTIFKYKNTLSKNDIYKICLKAVNKDVSYDTFNYLYDRVVGFTSLDNPSIEDPSSYYRLVSKDSVEDMVEQQMLLEHIRNLVMSYPKLSKNSVDIYLFWFNNQLDGNWVSFEDIGKKFGDISKQRVKQIINNINKKIKRELERLG